MRAQRFEEHLRASFRYFAPRPSFFSHCCQSLRFEIFHTTDAAASNNNALTDGKKSIRRDYVKPLFAISACQPSAAGNAPVIQHAFCSALSDDTARQIAFNQVGEIYWLVVDANPRAVCALSAQLFAWQKAVFDERIWRPSANQPR